MIEFDNLTYLHGKPQGTGLLKANPEDFVVVEDLGFEPDGEGEHILVKILKNGCNTRFVADALAKFLKFMPVSQLRWAKRQTCCYGTVVMLACRAEMPDRAPFNWKAARCWSMRGTSASCV